MRLILLLCLLLFLLSLLHHLPLPFSSFSSPPSAQLSDHRLDPLDKWEAGEQCFCSCHSVHPSRFSGTKMARWDFSRLCLMRNMYVACSTARCMYLHFSVPRHQKVHLRQDPDFRVKFEVHLQILAPIIFVVKLTTSQPSSSSST